jgi:hypothetical protein
MASKWGRVFDLRSGCSVYTSDARVSGLRACREERSDAVISIKMWTSLSGQVGKHRHRRAENGAIAYAVLVPLVLLVPLVPLVPSAAEVSAAEVSAAEVSAAEVQAVGHWSIDREIAFSLFSSCFLDNNKSVFRY